MDDTTRITLEAAIGYTFRDPTLLERALTHRSWVEERHPGRAPAHESQQRLEFLGDAFLGYAVGHWLYETFPTADEGELTQRRATFVKGTWLHDKGAALGLLALVQRGRGEASNRQNRKVLEDTVEAVIGAIVLDGGAEAAFSAVRSWLPSEPPAPAPADPIVLFGEKYQAMYRKAPPECDYMSIGADHEREWTASIEVDGISAEGTGSSQKEAKRKCLEQILPRLLAGPWSAVAALTP